MSQLRPGHGELHRGGVPHRQRLLGRNRAHREVHMLRQIANEIGVGNLVLVLLGLASLGAIVGLSAYVIFR